MFLRLRLRAGRLHGGGGGGGVGVLQARGELRLGDLLASRRDAPAPPAVLRAELLGLAHRLPVAERRRALGRAQAEEVAVLLAKPAPAVELPAVRHGAPLAPAVLAAEVAHLRTARAPLHAAHRAAAVLLASVMTRVVDIMFGMISTAPKRGRRFYEILVWIVTFAVSTDGDVAVAC